MKFERPLANSLANAVMGWYTACLSNAELVEEVERALAAHGHGDMREPPEVTKGILEDHGRESTSL